MSNRLKFVVLARLVLLRFKPRDGFGPRPDVELEFLTIHFDLSRFLFERFDPSHTRRQLFFEVFPL